MFDHTIEPLASTRSAGNAAHAANIRLREIEARIASLQKAVEQASVCNITDPTVDWGYAGSYYEVCKSLERALHYMGVDFAGKEQ